MAKAIAYCAAKRGESRKSYTIHGQLSLIEAYARSNGYQLAACAHDELDSDVTPLALRDGGSELVRALKDEGHSVTTLIVLDESVFATVEDFFSCKRALAARGVSIQVIDPKPKMSLKRRLSEMITNRNGGRAESVTQKRG